MVSVSNISVVGPACQPMFHSLLPARNHSRCYMLPARLGPSLAAARPPRVAWPAGGRCPARLGQLRRQRYTSNFFPRPQLICVILGWAVMRGYSLGMAWFQLSSNQISRRGEILLLCPTPTRSNQTLSSAQCIICVKLKQWSNLLHTYRAC